MRARRLWWSAAATGAFIAIAAKHWYAVTTDVRMICGALIALAYVAIDGLRERQP